MALCLFASCSSSSSDPLPCALRPNTSIADATEASRCSRRRPTRRRAAFAWLGGLVFASFMLSWESISKQLRYSCGQTSAAVLQQSRPAAVAFSWTTATLRWKRIDYHGGRKPGPKAKRTLIRYLRFKCVEPGYTRHIISLMKERHYFLTSWEYILGMKTLTKVGLWQDALSIFKEMRLKNMEMTPTTYSAAIVAWNSGKKWQKALETLDEMFSHGMVPIRIGAEAALVSCEKGAKWQKAICLLDALWEQSTTPNQDTYLPVIRACENAGEIEKGDFFFWRMREHTKLMKVEEESGVETIGAGPPQAEPAPWRIPGAIAATAYDPPKLPARRRWKKKKEEELPDLEVWRGPPSVVGDEDEEYE
eukprot:TRINITY_DN28120_c0_g1_i1.p1 TRINITY_DN28120_c0_g1~~TRINITY_DN28120_c0_g1_i1.p1  ORF type:complete len:363 (+),score=53.53 TRINITY_DN28120_c0_g1_i1:67-1155(+)